MTTVTAERLLSDLSTQLDTFIRFLRTDMTPVILKGRSDQGGLRAGELIATGKNTHLWLRRLQDIHHWTNLAVWEQNWLRRTGRNMPTPCLGSHRLGTMATFIQEEELPDCDHTRKALQHGRKLIRFENEFGPGITLLFIPVLHAFRCLTLNEEARTVEMLRNIHYGHVTDQVQNLACLRIWYQNIHGIDPAFLCSPHAESVYHGTVAIRSS